MMIEAKIFKGIEYVQVSDLPDMQREKISQTINRDLLIKIMIDGKIVSDCLQYKDYSVWFNNVYRPAPISSESATKQKSLLELEPKLALNN